ncbi:MAG: M24 family metallopeptidase [Bdellovibrionota bacterium]
MKHKTDDLEAFTKTQRLAYQCVLEIKREIQPGWTEKQTARLMDVYLQDHGVRTFFHRSFAWFGDRSRFQGFKNYFDFMPSNRRLEPTDVIILDTAPIVEGYPGDVGYAYSVEPHEGLQLAKRRLLDFRKKIPSLFSSERSLAEIWQEIDRELQALGYDNIHSMYPFSVLGHQMHRIPLSKLPGLTIPFSLHSYWMFLSRGLFKELLGPKTRGDKAGLWAIEPHIGGAGFGAKFEEILVVRKKTSGEGYEAFWMDDEVPHLKEAAPA